MDKIELMKDELPSPDKCRCCLQEGDLRELWGEYLLDDGVIIYGQALVECFTISLHQPADVIEKICATCINKLQEANSFKKLVLESDKQMLEYYFQGEDVKMDDSDGDCQQSQSGENDEQSENEDSDNDKKRTNPEYLEIELLEAAGSNEPIYTIDPTAKRQKKNSYKQYSPEDLDKCIKAVKSEKMTKSQAASHFNVPCKTIDAKLRADQGKKEDQANTKTEMPREKYKSFLQEIKTILKYTNVTPYKSKTGQLSCAYCRTNIDDYDELRTHTKTVHAGERFSGVDVFMKANWLNEIIKIDILDIRCTICPAPIDSWNDMFVHLKETHSVDLDEAYTKVIPYKLTDPLKCALCEERCNTYTILDAHMNSHYSNYICGDCGDTFLAETRLKKHLETHSTEKFKCPFCPKTFTLDKYRKKHIDGVHQHGVVFRCRYCKEEFLNEFRRHQHMEKIHSEKIKTITCEYCEKTFTFRPYYLKHLRLTHTKRDVKYKCSMCDKMFPLKYELRKHEEWHMGYHKQTCLMCNRTFSSKQYLEKHYEKVHSDTEVLVLETGQS